LGFYGNPDCSATYTVSRRDGATFDLNSVDLAASDLRRWTGPDAPPIDPDFGVVNPYTTAFDDWSTSGTNQQPFPFYVSGLLNGYEVARHYYGAQTQAPLQLTGFTGIDAFELGTTINGRTYADDLSMVPQTPNAGHCYSACYYFWVTAFDVHPVPLPVPGMLLSFGLFALGALRYGRKG
jgi:hypothetical protein